MASNLTYFGTNSIFRACFRRHTEEISYENFGNFQENSAFREFSKGKPCMLVWDPGICQKLPEIPENFPGKVLEKGENFEKFGGNFREISLRKFCWEA